MKKKRVLAMVLAASLMFSQSAFAAEPVQTPQSEETTVNKEEQTQTEEENPVVPEEEKEEQAEKTSQTEEQTQQENNSVEVQLSEDSEEAETDSMEKAEDSGQLTETDEMLAESSTQPTEENGETESEESEAQEQTYYTSEATEKYILYLDYPVIMYSVDHKSTYELSFSDDSICSGNTNSNYYFMLEGLKEGTTTLSIKDSEGNVVKTAEVEVKAELPEDAVVVKDIALRSELLYEKDLANDGYLSRDEMSQITSLDLSNSFGNTKIEDLSSLEYAVNLKSMHLYGIADISTLSNVTSLTDLYLNGKELTDISALRNLTNLTYLYLSNTGVTDISVLNNLTKLERLYFENTAITDISSLSNLTSLRILYLGDVAITDINALSNLTNLGRLYLNNTAITDISALSNLTNLFYLNLSNCSNLTSIQSLYGLNNLSELSLSGTQVPDEEKLKMISLRAAGDMVKGEMRRLPAIYGILESDDTFYAEVSGGATEIAEMMNYGTNVDKVLAKETGAVELTLHLNEEEQKITINIDGISAEQEVGEAVEWELEESHVDGVTSAILASNGDLWKTYPEVKKVQANVKKYVSEWVYSGRDEVVVDYCLDENGVLWSGNTKIAENIKDMDEHYALTEGDVLIDTYNDDSIQIEDVDTWIGMQWDYNSVYVLKKDGTLWYRKEVEKDVEVNEFQKVADNVVQITEYGYLLGNGEFRRYYNGNVVASNVASVPDSIYEYYYGTDGNCYVYYGSSSYANIGEYQLKEYIRVYISQYTKYFTYFLTADDVLYCVSTDGEIKLLSENISELLRADEDYYESSVACKADNGTYYTISGDTISADETVCIQETGYGEYKLLVNQGENYGIVERNGIPILNYVTKIWSGESRSGHEYALRTDGTIWKIDGIPELYIDLNKSPVQSGDLNGDDSINITDLMMCLYYVSGRTELDSNAMLAADVNGDGAVTIIDLMRILYYVSGRNATL